MNARNLRRRTDTSAEAGFTLVELTVSLLAGLLVAMGVVALSREATTTFHEETRSSAAEAALRTAVDRLRADLERAGFMSTGNINSVNVTGAPRIARPLGQATNYPVSGNVPNGLKALASVTLKAGGAVTLPLSSAQPVALTPDLIQISGNMTSADQFEIASYAAQYQQGCTRIWLVPNSPAVYRVIGVPPYPVGGTQDTDMRAIFFPMGLQAANEQFLVRVVDASGCAQYLATCTATNGAGVDTNGPYVDISGTTPLVTAAATGSTCGVTGFGEGAVINPVQTVQWEITYAGAADPEPATYNTLGIATGDATKYDLMRTFVDASGTPVWSTSEIIAEYAVDLSFAFSVDQGTALAPNIVTYPFDAPALNNPYATPPFVAGSNVGPERIRSIQARLVTRTALPDRSVNIALPTHSGQNYGTEKFAYRYCMQASGCTSNPTNAPIWARTRTIVTEAALPNQAGNFY